MNRGELWWYEEPDHGRRPACILTRQAAVEVLRRVIVVPATGTIRGIPSEVALDQSDGAPSDCVLSLDKVRVASKSQLTEYIATLDPLKMREVCRALAVATGC